MNPLISLVLLISIVMTAIALVLSAGQPIIDDATNREKLREAEDIMRFIDNSINDVIEEGPGSKRVIEFSSPDSFRVLSEEDAIQFQTESGIIEYLSRKTAGNLMYVSGNDVSCYSGSDLTMENSYIKAVFQKIETNSAINTANNIIMLEEKTHNTELYPINTSIVIDDDPSTAYGTGYSEILNTGSNRPQCQVHFYVNSTLDYDVYYTLYAGADFLIVEVRNIA